MGQNNQPTLNTKTLYQETVERYWARLFKFCCIYLSDQDAAKDITQDIFLSLWENRDKLTDNTKIISYLMVACRNRCLNHMRNEQRKYSLDTEITEEQISLKINKYALDEAPSILFESLDLHKAINEALSLLRPRTQEIFRLRYYEGLHISEIALKTRLTGKTVEYHLNKAIKELQRKLSPIEFLLLLLFLSQ